jgi:broad specificity phosphatase PhoE
VAVECGRGKVRIIFTRHGESEANIERIISNRDLPHKLTTRGITQAATLAERLATAFNVQMLYTSPILRAEETAKILAKKLGLPIFVSDALREYDCGMMEGRGDSEAWATFRKLIHFWDEKREHDQHILPDGESFNDMRSRFVPFVTKVIEENKELTGDILLVSHGGLLHQMLPLVIRNIDRPFTKEHPIGVRELITCSITGVGLICNQWAGISLD